MYDASLGRWFKLDEIGAAMPSWSPCNFSFNNPIRFSDPDGNIPFDKVVDNYSKISDFGTRVHPISKKTKMHNGTDFTAKKGTSINTFASGRIVKVAKSESWGNYIVVDHGGGYYTLYAHIEDGGTKVKKNDIVTDGQKIASVGSTGLSSGPHLHIEVGEAKNLDDFLSLKYRDRTRTNMRNIGDLEKLLHPISVEDILADISADNTAVSESELKNEEGEVIGTRYENTGENELEWSNFVQEFLESYENPDNFE